MATSTFTLRLPKYNDRDLLANVVSAGLKAYGVNSALFVEVNSVFNGQIKIALAGGIVWPGRFRNYTTQVKRAV
jgi:hypothetical protein